MDKCIICGREHTNEKFVLPNNENKYICPICTQQVSICVSEEVGVDKTAARQYLENCLNNVIDSDALTYLSSVLSSSAQENAPETSNQATESETFVNSGTKIKVLASVFFWLEVIGFVIWGIVLWSENSYYNNTAGTALVIMLVGSLIAWITKVFTYGFGELVENTGLIAKLMAKADAEKSKAK